MTTVASHIRDAATSRISEESPGYLEVRDSRGLLPDLQPDPEVVRAVRRVDPRWRVEWDRARGRWVFFHDHENYRRQEIRYRQVSPGRVRSVGDPTFTHQTKDGKFLPLDKRVVRRVEVGAWLERNCRDGDEYDNRISEVLSEIRAERSASAADDRRHWIQEHRHGIARAWEDGTFFGPAARPTERA